MVSCITHTNAVRGSGAAERPAGGCSAMNESPLRLVMALSLFLLCALSP